MHTYLRAVKACRASVQPNDGGRVLLGGFDGRDFSKGNVGGGDGVGLRTFTEQELVPLGPLIRRRKPGFI
jgi:hypothetical protein